MWVFACLVKGVKVMERQRQKGRLPATVQLYDEVVTRWWATFGFQLKPGGHALLQDPNDNSIFGAIYQCDSGTTTSDIKPPKIVIAFRGTMIGKATVKKDIKDDIKCFFNTLHTSPRIFLGFKAVKSIVDEFGCSGVWLTGHSLGAAMALVIGRKMVLEKSYYLETYLFNPPFPAAMRVGKLIYNLVNKIKTRLLTRASKHAKKIVGEEDINNLSEWFPCLFINESDWICRKYGRHFEELKKKEASGYERTVAIMNSCRSLISNLILGTDSEPSHLIPSAHLITNSTDGEGVMGAHSLSQWWNPNRQQLRYKLYHFSCMQG